jgi:glycerol-3-phosphate cytidylyltransferase-like family protein
MLKNEIDNNVAIFNRELVKAQDQLKKLDSDILALGDDTRADNQYARITVKRRDVVENIIRIQDSIDQLEIGIVVKPTILSRIINRK